MWIRIVQLFCLFLSIKALAYRELTTFPEPLTHQHFSQLKSAIESLKTSNETLKKQIVELEQAPKSLTPNAEITPEIIGKTRLQIEQAEQEAQNLKQRIDYINKILDENSKRSALLYTAVQKLSNPLAVGSNADFQQHHLERTQTLLNLNEQYADLLHQQKVFTSKLLN